MCEGFETVQCNVSVAFDRCVTATRAFASRIDAHRHVNLLVCGDGTEP